MALLICSQISARRSCVTYSTNLLVCGSHLGGQSMEWLFSFSKMLKMKKKSPALHDLSSVTFFPQPSLNISEIKLTDWLWSTGCCQVCSVSLHTCRTHVFPLIGCAGCRMVYSTCNYTIHNITMNKILIYTYEYCMFSTCTYRIGNY